MEKVTTVTAAISAVIGIIATVYNMILKKDNKRTEKYYDEILKPFIVEYHKNKNLYVINFLNEKAERNNDAIPKYIFYLRDKGEDKSEDLKKILLFDYLDLYPNDNNKMMRFLEMISKILVFAIFAISFTCMLYGVVSLSFSMLLLLQFFHEKNRLLIELLGLSIICLAVSIVGIQMIRLIDHDMYTLKEKKIQKIIERKIQYYNKYITKYIF